MKKTLLAGLPASPAALSEAQVDTLCRFGQALIEKNEVMNLTAITEPSAVAELHFLDCIALLGAADFRGKSVIDVGCGAGFPGVPLKIAEPSIRLTLLDSLGKRMNWLAEVLPQLAVEAEIVTRAPRSMWRPAARRMTSRPRARWRGSMCWWSCVFRMCAWAAYFLR